jgi:hypothetical protein
VLQCCFDKVGSLKLEEVVFVKTLGGSNLMLGCCRRVDGLGAWVYGKDCGGRGTGESHVGGAAGHKEEVAMDASAELAVDGLGIGIELFLEKSYGGVVGDTAGGTVKGQEDRFGERGDSDGHGGVEVGQQGWYEHIVGSKKSNKSCSRWNSSQLVGSYGQVRGDK